MCSALFSVHGLKNKVYSCVHACFGSWIRERGILMCGALVSVHGLKNEFIFMCKVFVSVHGLENELY